mgnify:FL=1
MGFMMPMFRPWVPKRIQPWIYVVTVFCVQFTSGVYLGALDAIRGTTNFMIEDLLILLYAGLAGMAIYFPMLFRMKFRFTNQQLLCGAAIVIGVCNLITMHSTSMPVLMVVCFIAGMAKIQGTFECMSNIQLWITPRRDFAVFFPVLHIVLLTAIEGSGFLAAWFAHHFTWQTMHLFTVGTMSFILLTQLTLCRPFCPMPQRLPLKGIDFLSGLLISLLMLIVSYIFIYGDYRMWMDNRNLRLLLGVAVFLTGIVLHRLAHVSNPYVSLRLFQYRNVLPILLVTAIAELLLGCEHTLEEILYAEVYGWEELTKEELMIWALPGVYVGVAIDLLWLKVMKWKVWKLFGIGFGCILGYALLMYFTLDVNANIELYRLPIMLRGCAYAILAATLMWSLDESVHDLEHFFMGLFIFNIFHMYLAGAAGYAVYTKLFMHFLNDDMVRYGSQLTLTHLSGAFGLSGISGAPGISDLPSFMPHYLHSMMAVALKQIYGIVIWVSGFSMLAFFLLDIPAVRTNTRKIPYWPVFGIEMLAKIRPLYMRSWRFFTNFAV